MLKLPHALVLSTSVALGSAIGQRIAQQPTLRVLSESSIDEEQEAEAEAGAEAGAEAADADDGRQVVTARSVLYAYLIHQRSVAVPSETRRRPMGSLRVPARCRTPTARRSAGRARTRAARGPAAEVASLETDLRGQYEALGGVAVGARPQRRQYRAADRRWRLFVHARRRRRPRRPHPPRPAAEGRDGPLHVFLRRKTGGRWACFGGCRLLRRLPMPLTLCRLGCLYRVDRHALLGRRQLVIHPHYITPS